MNNNTSTFDCDVFGPADQSFNINNTSNFDGDMFGQPDPFMIDGFKDNSTSFDDWFSQADQSFMTDAFNDNNTSTFYDDMFGQPDPFMTNAFKDNNTSSDSDMSVQADQSLNTNASKDNNVSFDDMFSQPDSFMTNAFKDNSTSILDGSVGIQTSPNSSSMGPIESMWSTAYHDTSNNVAQKSNVDLLSPLLDDLGYSATNFVFPNTPPTSSPAAMASINPTPTTPPSAKKTRAKVAGGAKAPPKPHAPRKPSPSKAKPIGRVAKPTKAKAAPHNRTTSSPVERSIAELFNAPFLSLSHAERARLMLPLLQGVDPNTGLKAGVAGSMVPPPDFEYIGAHRSGGDVFANLDFTLPAPEVPQMPADYGTIRQREALERGLRR
jgi:hypothetical protein